MLAVPKASFFILWKSVIILVVITEKMRNKNLENQRGYSIIELVIGLLIIGLSLSIYQVSLNTAQLNKQARYQDLALRIASSKMEELRAMPYASLPAGGSFSHSLMSGLPSGQGTLTITNFNTRTKQVTVAVTWQSSTSTRNVTLDSLITEIGGM